MTCTDFERAILLEDAGELRSAERETLRKHLGECPDCRAFEADFRALVRRVSTGLASGESSPPPALTRRLLAEAAARAPVRSLRLAPSPRGVLALAASLALLFVGYRYFGLPERPASEPGRHSSTPRIAEVSALLAAFIEPDDEHAQEAEGAHPRSDLKSIARQLLILQDMTVDPDEEFADTATPPEENLPTSLRSRSSRGVPAGTCG